MRYHLIAVGGSIMHNLAIELKNLGNEVSGSDDIIQDPALTKLKKNGLFPEKLGWYPEKITAEIDVVIVGNHAKEDNPELLKARELGLKLYSFPEFIYHHAEHKQRIVIAGSHGKTTVTSMILHVLKKLNYPADYLVGAQLEGFETMVKLSDAPIFVMEGDEYLSAPFDKRPKFLVYKPHLLVLTGIAWDHINVFPTKEIYFQQFDNLLKSLEKATHIVYNESDKNIKNLIKPYQKNESLYFIPYKKLSTKKEGSKTYIKIENKLAPIQVFGEHNYSNIAAAWEVCKLLAINADEFLSAISTFKGASKRLEIIYQDQWNTIISDYAHSPSKVKASLDAVKGHFASQKTKIIPCLELHTFSSLNLNFMKNYKGVFKGFSHKVVFIDETIVENKKMKLPSELDVQSAFGEKDIQVVYNVESLEKILKQWKTESNVFLFMSSGNFGGFDFLKLVS
jgi:UDP-N-acetylmuramate: L-alanyl-gamma-D-glutamyl-meso-diaminopimelate ligase